MLYPSTDFSKITPISNAPDYISESQSLKTIAASSGAQRFEFDLTTAWEKSPKARALWAFLNARRQSQPFTLQLPIYDTANGVVTGTVTATAAYAVGGSAVLLNNYIPAIGDFMQFAGHSKVYQVEDIAGNNATIFPPLIKSVSLNEVVNVNNLTFTVRRKNKLSKLESSKGNKAKIKFKVIEAF